jgi:ZIP family zinc transporter
MSLAKVTLLGFIAGITILLGLPVARLGRVTKRVRAALNAFAIGVLVFLLVETVHKGVDPVETALTNAHDGHGPWSSFAGKALLFSAAFTVALVGLSAYDRWMRNHHSTRHHHTRQRAGHSAGAALATEFTASRIASTPAQATAVLIAVGIGMHNLAEGLSIGQAAAGGELKLAVLLVVGFALHNATEGFGIAGPLAGDEAAPSWGWLAIMGLIAGGPTFVGTIIGHAWVSTNLSMAFLSLAAGSILYVVLQLVGVATKLDEPSALAWGIVAGLLAGIGTDFILVLAGA